MKKILNFKNMNNVQKLIFIIIATVILVIVTWILRIIRNNASVKENALVVDNYNQINSFTYFSMQGTKTYDRQLYWDLNDIITNYINSVRYENFENEYSLKNYYDALTPEYKLHLGESGYINIANSFVNKFKIESLQETSYIVYDIIEEIYEMPNNMYLCDLNAANEQKAYIGIALNKNTKTFQIFYIE